MDYQVVRGKVLGEIDAADMIDGEALPHARSKQARDLHGADVLLDRVVGAGFGDKHAGIFGKRIDGQRAKRLGGQVALQTRKGDRESRKGNALRHYLGNACERLRIGNHQSGRLFQRGKGLRKLFVGNAQGHAVRVEQIAYCLHLRQDDASFRGFLVDGDDQDDHRTRRNKVADDLRIVHELLWRIVEQGLPQLKHACALRGAQAHQWGLLQLGGQRVFAGGANGLLLGRVVVAARSVLAAFFGLRGCRQVFVEVEQIRFIAYDDEGDFPAGKLGGNLVFVRAPCARLGYDEAQIAAIEHLLGALRAQLAYGVLVVVDACGIDEQHGS